MKSLFEKLRIKQPSDKSAINLGWLTELNNVDDLTALEKTTSFLSNFNHEASSEKTLQALSTIDAANYPRIEKVFVQYIRFDNLRFDLDERIAETIYYYYRQLYLNYHRQLEAMLSLNDKSKLHAQDIPIVTARALHAAACMVKQRYISRQPTSNAAWLQIFQLLKIGEQEALLDLPIKIYENSELTTLDAMFVHSCMLDSINKSNMNRQQIELAAGLIKKLAPTVTTARSYIEKKHLYFIDLNLDKGAQRVNKSLLNAHCRFWETDELSIKIDLVIHCIKTKKPLEPFALGEMASNPHLLEILTHLQSEWSRAEARRQRRKENRKSTSKVATVSWGIEAVTSQIKQVSSKKITSGKSFEERLALHSVGGFTPTILSLYATGDRWIISDESSKGLGAEVTKEHSMSVKPDKLAAVIFNDHADKHIIGVVRSVVELTQNKRHVGMEIMSKNAILVQVIKVDSQPTEISDNPLLIAENILGVSGLFLPAEPGLSDVPSIIVPRMSFVENSTYQINTMDKKIVVHLGAAIEQKDDWARVNITRARPQSA